MTLEHELGHLVQDFVKRVAELARRAAIESVRTALAPRGPQRLHLGEPPRPGRTRAARPAKRTDADLRALERTLIAFVEEHPGMRVEQINRALGTQTRELALPIRRLVASGTLRAQGRKRATRYSVAGESRNN